MKLVPRPAALLGLLGLVLMVLSVAGGNWALQGGKRTTDTPEEPAPASERAVVCFGHVDVEQGVTPLYPLQPGRVEELHVREGQAVKAGTVLFSLDRRAPEILVRQAEADLDAGRARLEQARKLLDQQPLREAQQAAAVEAVREKLRAAEAVLAHREELRRANVHGSPAEMEAARALVGEVKAALRAEEKKLDELRLNDPRLEVRRAEADVKAKEAALERARLAVSECDVTAPCDGAVLRLLVSKGETLGGQPRQPAAWFCPQGPRVVRAEVDQEFARRVAVGQAATVRDDTIDGERWTGRVVRLSDWYTQRRSILQEPLQFNDVRTLECTIALDPDQPPPRIGQRVRVAIGPGMK
jgi:multidrug resistance efflux pump